MKVKNPPSGRSEVPRFRLLPEPSDRHRYAGGGICTPEHLAACIAAANSGDIEQLCLVGRDIMERNWDIGGAMEQRVDALTGCQWSVQPGDDRPASKLAAEKFSEALLAAGKLNGYDTFYDFCAHAMNAVVMPFAPAAIVWGEGGTLEGFRNLDPWNFTLRDGFTPRLITDEFPTGMPEELQTNGFVFHSLRKKSDPEGNDAFQHENRKIVLREIGIPDFADGEGEGKRLLNIIPGPEGTKPVFGETEQGGQERAGSGKGGQGLCPVQTQDTGRKGGADAYARRPAAERQFIVPEGEEIPEDPGFQQIGEPEQQV